MIWEVNILCVQETGEEVSKAGDIEAELELVYHGMGGKRRESSVQRWGEYQRLTSLKLEIEEVMFKVVSGDAHRSDVRVLIGASLKLKREKKKVFVLSLYIYCIMKLQGQTEG